MSNTRFIFVEGIMGAGKSTTAWFLTEQIQQYGTVKNLQRNREKAKIVLFGIIFPHRTTYASKIKGTGYT